jgi:hypothetical protein
MNNIYLGGGSNYTVQASQNVELRETLTLLNGSTEPLELDIKIIADFSSIPEQYHEVFLNMMTSRYYRQASFGDNPFSQCLPPKRKKWWQFWKIN